MYNQFNLVGLNFDAGRGEIEIQFSLAIEPTTANLNTLFLFDEKTRDQVPFELRVEQKSVFIKPFEINTDCFVVNIRDGISSIAGDILPRKYKHRVKTDVELNDKPSIKLPLEFETLYKPRVVVSPGELEGVSYEIVASSDTAFNEESFRTILDGRTEIDFRLAEYGQYFVKVRSIKESARGKWSAAVSFTYEKKPKEDIGDESFDGPVIATDLICIKTPESGVTPKSFIFEFDEELDDAIGNITVTRRLV